VGVLNYDITQYYIERCFYKSKVFFQELNNYSLSKRDYGSIPTDLIKALPGNSSVNTAQFATVEEAVFSVDPTNTPIHWLDSDHVTYVSCDASPFPGYISMSPGGFKAVTSYVGVVAAEAREQGSQS
jgi:hypothetical protein